LSVLPPSDTVSAIADRDTYSDIIMRKGDTDSDTTV
jgi:hypothetical protein